MQGKIYEIPLDISNGVLTTQIRTLVTEDMGTNTFRFKVVRDNHVPYDFTGTTVRMMVKTPSGARIQQECTIENAIGGTVSLTLKQSLLLEHGSYIAELQIFDAITQSIRLTTPTFTYHVRQSLQNSESIVATDEYTILQEALADLAGINIVVANKADQADLDVVKSQLNENATELSKKTTGYVFTTIAQINALYGTLLKASSTVKEVMESIREGDSLNGVHMSGNSDLPFTYCIISSLKKGEGTTIWCQAYSDAKKELYYRVLQNKIIPHVLTDWTLLATTDKIDILCTPKAGYLIESQYSFQINNVIHYNIRVKKSDSTPFAANSQLVVATMPSGKFRYNTPVSCAGLVGTAWVGSASGLATTAGDIVLSCITSNITSILIEGVLIL